LRRDLGPYLTTRYTTTAQIAALITSTNAIGTFQDTLQGGTGLHGSAHFTIGSDPGGDFYNSPGDPAFWLLHSMIDRVWYIWQSQDLKIACKSLQARQYVWRRRNILSLRTTST
jgi:tyrosinase